MKVLKITMALAVMVAVNAISMRTARGELVFDEDLNSNVSASSSEGVSSRSDERRQVTRSESMRRQRLREELRNEDLLTQKLEELRLRDEMRRTQELSGTQISAVQKAQSAPLTEEHVGSAMPAATVVQPQTAAQPANVVGQTAVAVQAAPVAANEEDMRVNITVPRAGLTRITNSMYDVESRYSLGLDLSVDVTQHFAFTAGYTYSDFNLGPGSAITVPSSYYGYSNYQRLRLKDHVASVGARAYVLGYSSRVRPFIGAGVAYRRGNLNYSDSVKNSYQSMGYVLNDITMSGIAGMIETGLDFRITKNIGISAMFKYYNMFSSSQSAPVDPYGFYPNMYGYSGVGYTGDARTSASNALVKNSFYSLMAGLTLTF